LCFDILSKEAQLTARWLDVNRDLAAVKKARFDQVSFFFSSFFFSF
jgi:hypothetical protein